MWVYAHSPCAPTADAAEATSGSVLSLRQVAVAVLRISAGVEGDVTTVSALAQVIDFELQAGADFTQPFEITDVNGDEVWISDWDALFIVSYNLDRVTPVIVLSYTVDGGEITPYPDDDPTANTLYVAIEADDTRELFGSVNYSYELILISPSGQEIPAANGRFIVKPTANRTVTP